MAFKIQSNSSHIGATNRQFIIPSGSQLLLYALISCLLLVILNAGRAWNYLNDIVLSPQGGLDKLLSSNAPEIHKLVNAVSHSILLQVVFWIVVGCLVYIFIWFVKNIAINMLNDIAADQYVHPASYKRARFWESVIVRRIFFWTSAVILVFYSVAATRLLVYLANVCYRQILHFQFLQSSLEILESIAAVAGLIYVLILIVHIVMNSWRVMYKDL
jgi:hypothetical protein